MLDTLKRQILNYRDLVMDLYDKQEASADSIKAMLCNTIDNRTARENPVRLSHVLYTSEAVAWEDEIVTGGAIEEIQFAVPIKGYDVFTPFNKVNIERPESIAKLEAAARTWPKALERLQVKQILSVFRSNPLAYDGQNFFDSDHVHPATAAAYSNILSLQLAGTIANITFAEAKTLIHQLRARFMVNMSLQAEILSAAEMAKNMIVIAHTIEVWPMLDLVRPPVQYNNIPNELVNSFQLLYDPNSGTSTKLEAILSEPGGARPVFFVPDKDPYVDAWATDAVRNGYVATGLRGQWGFKPGMPQTAIQATLVPA